VVLHRGIATIPGVMQALGPDVTIKHVKDVMDMDEVIKFVHDNWGVDDAEAARLVDTFVDGARTVLVLLAQYVTSLRVTAAQRTVLPSFWQTRMDAAGLDLHYTFGGTADPAGSDSRPLRSPHSGHCAGSLRREGE